MTIRIDAPELDKVTDCDALVDSAGVVWPPEYGWHLQRHVEVRTVEECQSRARWHGKRWEQHAVRRAVVLIVGESLHQLADLQHDLVIRYALDVDPIVATPLFKHLKTFDAVVYEQRKPSAIIRVRVHTHARAEVADRFLGFRIITSCRLFLAKVPVGGWRTVTTEQR